MASLTPQIKRFIVQALACFDTLSQVAEAVKSQYGLVVSRQQVEIHDPTKRCSKGLAKRWVYLFHDTRAAFHSAIADIPIANRSYRLRVLDKMAVDAEKAGNLRMACQLFEQAARECGDMYLSRRRTAGSSHRPNTLVVQQPHIMEYTLSPGSR